MTVTGPADSADSARRILFVDHCARMGGAQFNLLVLVEDLVARGHLCDVVLAEDGPLVEVLRKAGADVTVLDGLGVAPADPDTLHGERPAHRPGDWWTLIRKVRTDRPDIVHINSARSVLTVGAVFAALRIGPRVWTAHDIVHPAHFSPPIRVALRVIAPLVSNRVVANSRATRDSLGRAGRRAAVVYPGVGPIAPSTAGDGPLRVLMLGRLAPLKGQDVVVDAVAHAEDRAIEVDIVGEAMFGEHDYEDGLAERIAAAGLQDRVRMLGAVAEPSAVLADYDVLVHASRWPEAFGRVVAEGLMAGLAVIATRTGGPAEQITDGMDGLLVEPDDSVGLAAALDRLAADPALRARLREAAPAAGARFDRDQHAEGYLAAYRELAPTPGPPAAGGAPTITVIVPSYRRPESLLRTLKSLDALDDQPDEVLVVAQLQDEPTWRAAEQHGVRVVPTEPGLAAAMAAGARAASSDVVAFTDDDAEPLADWTARIRAAYRDNPRLGAFGGRDLVDGDTDEPVASSTVGKLTWFGRILGWHHAGTGSPQHTHQLKGVNLSARRAIVDAVDLGHRVRGTGAQHGNELFVTASALRAGWEVVYDPSLQVVHHVEPRDDGTIRSGKQLRQLSDDMANLTGAAAGFLPGIRRWTVPAYAVLVGERVRPGVVAGLLLRFVDHDEGAWPAVAAVWRGVIRGVSDARRGVIHREVLRGERR